MSQIIAYKSKSGVVFAADSKSWNFQPDGTMSELIVNRVVRLSQKAAIVAGGTSEGVDMCGALAKFVQGEGLENVDEIYRAAVPFLGSEYEKFMPKECEMPPLDPIHNIYFVLGGCTGDESQPFRLYLIWTKKKLPQLDGDEISHAYTVPRRMGLEYTLNQLGRDDAPLNAVLEKTKEAIEKLGESQEEVGPPFRYASIREDGFREMT